MEKGDTLVITLIVITSISSFIGFNDQAFFERCKFNVGAILKGNQWDRLVSSAFLHGDMMHLLFNMMTLFFFSDIIIRFLGIPNYMAIYFAAIIGGSLLSLWVNRKNPYYSAIGASGGVSGVLFAAIAIYPHLELFMFFMPIPIKGWIFGILYLAYSVYGMKTHLGNIGHSAHLGGAAIGILLAILFEPHLIVENGIYIAIMIIPLIALSYYVYKER